MPDFKQIFKGCSGGYAEHSRQAIIKNKIKVIKFNIENCQKSKKIQGGKYYAKN